MNITNDVIEVLNSKCSTKENISYIYQGYGVLAFASVYFKNYRIVINSEIFNLYYQNSGFYESIIDGHRKSGLGSDEYFNLSLIHDLNELCLKENVDIIRDTLHNTPHGVHIINFKWFNKI